MLLQLTILLLPLLDCRNSHAVGKISLKMQVVRMDCTIQYLRHLLQNLSSEVKKDGAVDTFIMFNSLQFV